MPSKCCRSCPRCADCPVRLAAAARARQQRQAGIAALVDEIFAGRPPRELPQPVTVALATIEAERLAASPVVPQPAAA